MPAYYFLHSPATASMGLVQYRIEAREYVTDPIYIWQKHEKWVSASGWFPSSQICSVLANWNPYEVRALRIWQRAGSGLFAKQSLVPGLGGQPMVGNFGELAYWLGCLT